MIGNVDNGTHYYGETNWMNLNSDPLTSQLMSWFATSLTKILGFEFWTMQIDSMNSNTIIYGGSVAITTTIHHSVQDFREGYRENTSILLTLFNRGGTTKGENINLYYY